MLKYYFLKVLRQSFLFSIFLALLLGATYHSSFNIVIRCVFMLCFIAPTFGFIVSTLLIKQSYKPIKYLAFNCNIHYLKLVLLSFLFTVLFYSACFAATGLIIKYV